MKLLLWDCKFLRFKDKRPSSRPEGIKHFLKTRSEGQFENVLSVFVCVEENDNKLHVQKGVEEILKILNMLKSKRTVIIIPFVHLSSHIASPQIALSLINELASQLRMHALNVDMISFGYHKDFELHFIGRGHPGSVAFRDLS
jgi:threonyl-tRNA synthetase